MLLAKGAQSHILKLILVARLLDDHTEHRFGRPCNIMLIGRFVIVGDAVLRGLRAHHAEITARLL